MSRNSKPRKPYRPRLVTADTMAIALYRVAKPPRSDVDEVLQAIQTAFKALREGVATELQWSILAGSLDVSKAIERQGVVRGLSEHLASAETALQAVYDRARKTNAWYPPVLHFHELDAVREFVHLHDFQVRQLSRAEFLAAIDLATGQIRSNGQQPTVVRDIERMAA
jgi:hypothetical protein